MLYDKDLSGAFEPPDRATDCVITLDRDWHIVALDANAREKLGFDDEFLGRDLLKLFPLSAATHAREILQSALEKGEATHFRFYGRELGSWFDIRARPTESGLELAFRDLLDGEPVAGSDAAALSNPAFDKIADEMRRMADQISQGVLLVPGGDAQPASDRWSDGRLALIAEAIYRDRRRRANLLPVEFGEPQWDILLDLFIQAVRSNLVSVTSACIAAAVPSSTALRALEQLGAAGLVSRKEDLQDKRRVWVALSRQGMDAMRRFLRHSAVVALDIRS